MPRGLITQLALAVVGIVLVIISAPYIAENALLGWIGVASGALVIFGAVLALARKAHAASRH